MEGPDIKPHLKKRERNREKKGKNLRHARGFGKGTCYTRKEADNLVDMSSVPAIASHEKKGVAMKDIQIKKRKKGKKGKTSKMDRPRLTQVKGGVNLSAWGCILCPRFGGKLGFGKTEEVSWGGDWARGKEGARKGGGFCQGSRNYGGTITGIPMTEAKKRRCKGESKGREDSSSRKKKWGGGNGHREGCLGNGAPTSRDFGGDKGWLENEEEKR